MKVVIFDKNERIASKLSNILQESYGNIKTFNTLLPLLESISNLDNEAIFVIAENFLNAHCIKIGALLKKFDCYSPIVTYSISSDIYLNVDINYIYEYHQNNCKTFVKDIYKIESCFNKFASDKEYFSSYNFCCKEVPVSLKKNIEIHNLYEVANINTMKTSDITSCLTKMQAKLFMFLLSHEDGVSLSDILYNLWASDNKSKAQSVYTLVHGLNRIISQKTTNKYQIIHQNKKYQLIQITKSSIHPELQKASVTGDIKGCSIAR
ncbi:MAG: hypothetical protein ACTTIZ_02370 [Treponema sp.]